MSFCAAPGVLIAVPQLDDSNFQRSVIVMIEHGPSGALGLIVNHPAPHPARSVAESLGLDWPGPEEALVLRGGPVEPQSLWMLHDDGWGFEETTRVAPGVSVSRSREALTRMCEAREQRLVLVVGYAGWGAGQLEQEIAAGSWVTAPICADLVFSWPREAVWTRALHSIGVDPAHLVEGGGVQ